VPVSLLFLVRTRKKVFLRIKGVFENLQYPYFCVVLIEFVNKKEREKDLEEEIDKALKHEENVQHDENEKPITFAERTNNEK